jgi:hypothetical protein
MKSIKFIFIALLISISAKGIAQEQDQRLSNPLVTDRPDATEASSTVGKGVLQLETGGLYETFEANNVKQESYTYNTMLIRYGLLNNL